MVNCYSKKYVVLLTFSILLSQIFTKFLHGLKLLHAENNFNTKLLEFDASKIPPPPSKIAAYQVTDPTIRIYDGPISNLWISSYQNPWSNLLCGGGAT